MHNSFRQNVLLPLGEKNFARLLRAAGYGRLEDVQVTDTGRDLYKSMIAFARGVEQCRRLVGTLDKSVTGPLLYNFGIKDPAEAENAKALTELHETLKAAVEKKATAGATA